MILYKLVSQDSFTNDETGKQNDQNAQDKNQFDFQEEHPGHAYGSSNFEIIEIAVH